MVLRTGPMPSAQPSLNADLAREVAARLIAGHSEQLICFQLSGYGAPDYIQKHIQLARQNPFFQGASAISDMVQRQNWILETERASQRLHPKSGTIPRRDRLSPETFLKEHYSVHRPVILTGLVDDWPALSKWSPDYMEDKVGRDTPIELQKGRESTKSFEIDKLKLKTQIPFGEMADFLRSGKPSNDMYVTANNGAANRQALAPLWEDFSDIPGFTQSTPENDGFLWIGPQGTLTPFHHDLTHNLLIQVAGRKKVHVVPSYEEARMRPVRKYFSQWSLDDMLAAPAERRPQLLECEIGPGDALYIPVGWWHHVIGLEQSYSVLFTNFVWPNTYTTAYMGG